MYVSIIYNFYLKLGVIFSNYSLSKLFGEYCRYCEFLRNSLY